MVYHPALLLAIGLTFYLHWPQLQTEAFNMVSENQQNKEFAAVPASVYLRKQLWVFASYVLMIHKRSEEGRPPSCHENVEYGEINWFWSELAIYDY